MPGREGRIGKGGVPGDPGWKATQAERVKRDSRIFPDSQDFPARLVRLERPDRLDERASPVTKASKDGKAKLEKKACLVTRDIPATIRSLQGCPVVRVESERVAFLASLVWKD